MNLNFSANMAGFCRQSHIGYEYHTISWDGVYCIPKMGMLSVSREITPFWYEIHTFVLTVCRYLVRFPPYSVY